MRFANREQAGRLLAQRLGQYADRADVIVLALPRGGVPVGFAVAQALHAPLDVLVVRKLGVPQHPEYAMGAVASGGVGVLHTDLLARLKIPMKQVDDLAATLLEEIAARELRYRAERTPQDCARRVVILVDDGLATGSTMSAALRALRQAEPARVIVAVPVAPAETCAALGADVDELICLSCPEPFHAVGLWYDDFTQTSDQQVCDLLAAAAHLQQARATAAPGAQAHFDEVQHASPTVHLQHRPGPT